MKPKADEYADFYKNYIELVPEVDFRHALVDTGAELVKMFRHHETNVAISDYRYAEGKWSVAQVLLHLIDSENVFVNRALWAARGAVDELPGFDHNAWVVNNPPVDETVSDIIQWFRIQRQNTVLFFDHVNEEKLTNRVVANNAEFTVRSLAFIIAGHTRHHANILRERYLNAQ
ncbi:DinB family protein [Phaeocystidibacter luteus]|uniref:DinB family protein n=1 Tax=Phaeocystidibacter luteus TaxID=911197 RepID=A0A6N6RIN8_9FLAO|nr:DinB family protein [Phaeocystidibacter luteus]KAB2814213.1 DinB family protein [Phaeocystidibacter luteus]